MEGGQVMFPSKYYAYNVETVLALALRNWPSSLLYIHIIMES